MAQLKINRAGRWFALPTIVALICIAAGAWVQLKTAGLVAFVGAPLYMLAAAVTLFAAYRISRSAARPRPAYRSQTGAAVAASTREDAIRDLQQP